MKHRSPLLRSLLWQVNIRRAFVALVLVFALVALSGCSTVEKPPQTGDSTGSSADPIEEVNPAAVDEPAPEAVSEDLDPYSAEDEQLIYYGEVLAFRYGIDVEPDEWLSLAEKECDSYSEAGSTRVYGPESAEILAEDPRSGLLLESFVFLVIGSYWCGVDDYGTNFERYGSEAQLISLAFLETVNAIGPTNLSAADFSDYYDNQLFITRYDFDTPPESDRSDPTVPDAPDPYESSDPVEDEAPEYGSSDPDYPYPGPYNEHEGNSGGPTQCNDGTVSNSSGQGTCSWHGGER